MKILFLCHSLDVGGIETYILRFSKWLSHHHPEHQLEVLCKSGTFGSYEADFRELNIPLHSMPMGYFNPLPYLRFHRLLKAGGYDAICDFGGDFGGGAMLVSYAANVGNRLVFYRSARSAYAATTAKVLYQRLLNCLVTKFSTWILSNSQEGFDHFFGRYAAGNDRRFRVIRNGVPAPVPLSVPRREELRRSLGAPPGHKIVLHVGSGRWEKNHSCMLQMAKLSEENDDHVVFCFVGPGVEKVCGAEAAELGLENIRFLGERRDVGDLLQVSDVFLFPSLSEGQPNALLEAMIHGVPFVASDIAPVRESLPSDWRYDWLFSPEAPCDGYRLLQHRLHRLVAEDQKFLSLVEWSKVTYNENVRFEEFLTCLTSTFS